MLVQHLDFKHISGKAVCISSIDWYCVYLHQAISETLKNAGTLDLLVLQSMS